MAPRPAVRTTTITSTGTTSAALNVQRYLGSVAIIIAEAHTGATMTFTGSDAEAGTYVAVKDADGNTVSIPTTAAATIGLSGAEADALLSQHWIKCVSAGAEASTRTVKLLLK